MTLADALSGGFADGPKDAAYAFRGLLSALARPGRIETIEGTAPPAPLSGAAGALLLTLCDPDTPVHLAGDADTRTVREWIAFYTGAPLSGPSHRRFAIGDWTALQPLDRFPIGTPEYPDRSATLIVEVEALSNAGATLRGPGIETEAELSLPDTEPFQRNARHFPLGLDFFFTCGNRVAGLPRTTRVG